MTELPTDSLLQLIINSHTREVLNELLKDAAAALTSEEVQKAEAAKTKTLKKLAELAGAVLNNRVPSGPWSGI